MKKIQRIFGKLRSVVYMDNLKLDLYNTQIQQRNLFFLHQEMRNKKEKLPDFKDVGFRVYSQNDEDGKIQYIFSMIGFKNKICVDMAYSSPIGANTTNLICNWGFSGLLVEGKEISDTKSFFENHRDTWIYPPTSVRAWITAENVNDLCVDNGFTGEIDLFSLDMDGVDYHIWSSLTAIQPRVVIVEYLDILGPDVALTVPYKHDFNRFDIHENFFSASLLAFVKLGKKKGYRLVGTNQLGYNAFFVKDGIEEDLLPEVSVNSCFEHPKVKWGIRTLYPEVKNLPWIEV